ncbi:dihydrofolate reductase family protein [Actinopolymorpha sp. B11F2]|uniref:dihydrofolate reductase family protein n=1 Tax=Actinopolymorpha sp. B11F2 TaxID=3160862 RepID=UPI0032E40B80
MRSLIVSCNVTVDGFMAGLGNDLASLDFIVPDSEQENALAARFREVADTIVFGRQTFLDMEAYWTKVDSDMAAWINATPKVVLSTDSGADVSIWNNTTLAAGDGAERVRRLKASEGGGLVMFGGVQTIRSMIAADLVDEYWLKISPVAVGQGSSMFADLPERRSLTLRGAKGYPSGMLDVTYAK